MLALFVSLVGIIPTFVSWNEAALQSSRQQAPIVLYISKSTCTFCKRFEQAVFEPIIRSGDYPSVVFRELVLDESTTSDFGALTTTLENFQTDMNIIGTPSVIFLDSTGSEIARRFVGYNGNDYASFMLERSIKQAMQAMHASSTGPAPGATVQMNLGGQDQVPGPVRHDTWSCPLMFRRPVR